MDRLVDVLVLATGAPSVEVLERGLVDQGYIVDVVSTLEEAQQEFLARGGHRLLVVTPEANPALVQRVIENLRGVDPDLPIVLFGDDTMRGSSLSNLHRIRSFHPGSRAGIGAVQKVICGLVP